MSIMKSLVIRNRPFCNFNWELRIKGYSFYFYTQLSLSLLKIFKKKNMEFDIDITIKTFF